MIKRLLLFALAIMPAICMAQSDCLQQLQAICRQEQEYQKKMMESSGWYLKYKLESQAYNPAKDNYMPAATDGEMIASKDIRYYKTQELEVLIDGTDIFTIDNSKKTIMRTRSGKHMLAPQSNPYLDLLSDSTMKNYRITSCQLVNEQGKQLRRYDMAAFDKKKTPYIKMSIYVDEEQKMFRKIYCEINTAYYKNISSYTFVVKERGKRSMNSWYPVRKKVLAANGRLKTQYANYEYKDLATRKPNQSQSAKKQ